MGSKFQIKKNVISAVISFSVNIILVFVSYRLVIRQGGVDDLGLWSTMMAWVYMIRLGDVGMASAISRFVSMHNIDRDAEKIRKYIDTGFLFNVALFLFLSVSGYALMSENLVIVVPPAAIAKAVDVLPLMMVGFFLTNISGLMLGALQGLHWGFVSARLSTVGSCLQLVAVVVLVPRLGLPGLAWGVIVQHAAMTVVGWALVRFKLASGPLLPVCWSRAVHKEMFGYSVKIQFVNLTNGLFEPLSKILISRFSSLEVQGLYELAYKTVALPRNAVMSGAQATLPAMTGLLHTDKAAAKDLYKKMLRLVLRASAGVLVAVACASPLISVVWMGSLSYMYWSFVALLACGFFVNSLGAPAYNLGLASGIVKNNFRSAALTLFVMGLLGLSLGFFCGALGVAVASGCSLAAGGLYIKFSHESEIFERLSRG